jgi:hypothetical protein
MNDCNHNHLNRLYHVVWIKTGEPLHGTHGTIPPPPSHDEHALRLALAQMLETVNGLRGKVEVRPVAASADGYKKD